MRRPVLAVLLLALPLLAGAAPNDTPWPPREKAAAINGCREGMLDNIVRQARVRKKMAPLPEGMNARSLDPATREKMVAVLAPTLNSCDCAFGYIEKQWNLEFVKSNPTQVEAMLMRLMGGPCKPGGPAPKKGS
jgi:hypothetical protein